MRYLGGADTQLKFIIGRIILFVIDLRTAHTVSFVLPLSVHMCVEVLEF